MVCESVVSPPLRGVDGLDADVPTPERDNTGVAVAEIDGPCRDESLFVGHKWCPQCERSLSRDEFGRNRARPDGLQAQCRGCLKGIQKVSRQRPAERERGRRNRDGQRRKLRMWVKSYLETHPCEDCGEPDPVVLEFDHVRGDKVAAVAEMIRDAVALPRLVVEVEKCAVRCANCHRRKTARDRGYYTMVT
jgi:hypothetical protein